MPDAFEVGAGGFAVGLAQGMSERRSYELERQRLDFARQVADRNAGFADRRLQMDEEIVARERQRWNDEIAAAQAEARQYGAGARQAVREGPGDALARKVQKYGGTPVGAIAMHALESMPVNAADAYVDRVVATASAIQSPEARSHYLDRSLAGFERMAGERELAEAQQWLVGMMDAGAFAGVGAEAGGGAAGADAGAQAGAQAAAGPDVLGNVAALHQGLATAQTVGDLQAVRGGIRALRVKAGQAAQILAQRRAGVNSKLTLRQSYTALGVAASEKGEVETAKHYFQMAENALRIPDQDAAQMAGQMGLQPQGAALAGAQASGEGGAGTGAAQPKGKPSMEQLAAEGRKRGVTTSKATALEATAKAREIVGQDASGQRAGIAAEGQRTAKAVADEQSGPREAQRLDEAGRSVGFSGPSITAGPASWAAAFEAALQDARAGDSGKGDERRNTTGAGRAKMARRRAADLLAWAEKYGDEQTKAVAKVARERMNAEPAGGGEEKDWSVKYRGALGRPWAEAFAVERGQ